ncbi:MAG TPA: ABC transporter ATP-binding protein [Haploplasma sp.]|nr:ABC transporter ATP-binding protein [Haploplasma sp.]
MLKMFKHLKTKEWFSIFISLGLIIFQVWLDFTMLDYSGTLIRLVQNQGSTSEMWYNGGMMLLSAFGSLSSAVVVGFLMARTAARFAEGLRFNMFEKIDSFSTDEINQFSTSSLITRTTNDVSQVQIFITMGSQLLIKAPILAIWSIIKIYSKGIEWTIAVAIAIILITVLIGIILLVVMPKFKKVQKITDDLTSVTRENLTGVRVVRAYNAEEYQAEKFKKVNNTLTKNNLFTSRGMSVMMPTMNAILSLLSLSVYIIGAILIVKANGFEEQVDLFANMTVFIQYAMQLVMAYMMLVMVFFLLPRSTVSAKRINEVLDTIPSIQDGIDPIVEEVVEGMVEFNNVSFKYPDAEEYILKDISFKAQKGQTIAFIGSTGSGKSTLINLVPRFYDVSEGEVLINNVDVRDYKNETLNNLLGYVPQKAVLFKGTIRSNILYGSNGEEDRTDDDVWKALEIAQGLDFVKGTENGLDHEIAQSGTNLSGGQKQRVAIARAVARKPEIFIFDDSFSALDYKTDQVLREQLKKHTSGATSLIVAQRIGTIIDADQIIVLDKGRIVGHGKHRELLKTCDVYKEIAMSQLSEEELA